MATKKLVLLPLLEELAQVFNFEYLNDEEIERILLFNPYNTEKEYKSIIYSKEREILYLYDEELNDGIRLTIDELKEVLNNFDCLECGR